ncbi:MAG TPA: prepilin-type N-terminal cleavage/methylation domain-containing protein [Candidatus Paceibacterota bacterium]|nr:prepilin-type N-terminal cleavage/methylation domain-containing protein [Candidatus Paceibacterota bacterium]
MRNTHKGFTLIETLVAIFIISIAIVATMSSAQRALQTSYYARDQVVGFFLADEAMEIVQNIRDSNFKSGNHWLTGIIATDAAVNSESVFCTDITTNSRQLKLVGTAGCPVDGRLYQTSAGKYTNVSTGNNITIFKRQLSVKRISEQEIQITVSLKWKTGSMAEREFKFYKSLLNWK